MLGTESGLLHTVVVEERSAARKDLGTPRQLLDLRDPRKAVCGLHQVRLSTGVQISKVMYA